MNIHDKVEPTPQDYGLPENPQAEQLQVWFRQEAFLKEYAKCGKMGRAAKASGITRWCVDKWLHNDVYAIKKRMAMTHQDYVEQLETEMDGTVTKDPVRAQILQIFRLKAEAPEKYREEVKVVGVGPQFELLDRIREMAAKELKEREALEGPAIEGQFKELEAPRGPLMAASGNPPPMPPRVDQPMGAYPENTRISSPEPSKKPKKPPSRIKRW